MFGRGWEGHCSIYFSIHFDPQKMQTLQLSRFRLESQDFELDLKVSSLKVLFSSKSLKPHFVYSKTLLTRLSRIAMLILVLPHSNAEEERVFSMVRKNKTAFRANLDPKGTLSSILTNWRIHSQLILLSQQILFKKKVKSATYEYNRAHKNK